MREEILGVPGERFVIYSQRCLSLLVDICTYGSQSVEGAQASMGLYSLVAKVSIFDLTSHGHSTGSSR